MLRKFVSSLLIAIYLAVASGVAWPDLTAPSATNHSGGTANTDAGNSSEEDSRYPCEDRQCGCPGGLHCWTQCQCGSLPEKLSWARRNQVRPPLQALAIAKQRGLDISPWQTPTGVADAGPVPSHTRPKVTQPKPETENQHCCNGCSCGHDSARKTVKAKPAAPQRKSVILIQALQCKGLSYDWLVISPAVLPTDSHTVTLDRVFNESSIILSESHDSFLRPIEPPPPRCA